MARWNNELRTDDEIYRLKRRTILSEAARTISRRGYHNTSLDDIAESLKVSKGTLYNYVKDKQEILFECHKMALDISERSYRYAHQQGRGGYDKLRLMVRCYVTWMNGTMGGAGIISDVGALRLEDRNNIIGRRDAVDAHVIAFIEEGITDGTIRAVDPRLARFAVMGAVNSIPLWFSPDGPLSSTQIAEGMVDILMQGLGTSAAKMSDHQLPSYAQIEASDHGEPVAASPVPAVAVPKRKPAQKAATPKRSKSAVGGTKTKKDRSSKKSGPAKR
ncbi:MAG: TetR-family transcriptional regulator [Hydrocarboniphaga sp.]|uniref:TetR/AcrR family transcriptional regulator n=1 Tax=Hydrocarboniphaga sp. TaxID=2033016 RepID=UPI002603AD86|nr:TetR/AcrR family transcriptional regulator [Hydrocarboniphaga sp.]MDB5971167.1 TetR-family transcriptional regulator [Hydrocarboniphaga sp.]